MLSNEAKNALRAMMKDLEEESRKEARENFKGRVIDQTELCYKQYSPPQVENGE